MEHRFESVTDLAYPIDSVFAFFSDAGNLQRITPPELHFSVQTSLPIDIREGTLIDYRLKLFGVPFTWRTLISEWNPPHSFTDEQLRGPYAQWIHRHTFRPTPTGTEMRDVVRYRLPLSPLGDIAYPLVARQVARIFSHRGSAIDGLLREAFDPGRDT